MLFFVVVFVVMIISLIFSYLDWLFDWSLYILEIISISVTIVSIIVAIGMSISVLGAHIKAPAEKIITENKYESLQTQVEMIKNSDNYTTADQLLFTEVREWNENYLLIKHYSESPWFNVFCPKSVIENVDTIEIPTHKTEK